MGSKTSARSRTAWRPLEVALAAAVVFSAAPAQGAAPVLTWKLAAGDSLHYQMDQKTVTQFKGTNKDIKTTVTQVMDITRVVVSVDSSGTATMTQTIDRIRTKGDSLFGAFEYDSQSDKAPQGPVASGITPMLKALVGARFQFKMSPQGELSDIQVPDSVVKALKEAGASAPNVGMFSEEGLKTMIHDSSLVLPRDAEKGKTWTQQTKIPSPPIGTMRLDKTYTYTGTEKEGDKITLDVKVTLEPDPKSNIDIRLGEQEGKGTFVFDSAAGRVVSSVVTEKIELIVKVVNEEIRQTHDVSTTMTLLDPKARETK